MTYLVAMAAMQLTPASPASRTGDACRGAACCALTALPLSPSIGQIRPVKRPAPGQGQQQGGQQDKGGGRRLGEVQFRVGPSHRAQAVAQCRQYCYRGRVAKRPHERIHQHPGSSGRQRGQYRIGQTQKDVAVFTLRPNPFTVADINDRPGRRIAHRQAHHVQGADAAGEGHAQAGARHGRGHREHRVVVAAQRLPDPLPRDWRLGMSHALAHVRALPSPLGGISTGLERQLCYRLLRSREPHGRDRCAVRHCRRIGQERDQVNFGDTDRLGQRHLERLLPVAAVGRTDHRPHLQAVVMPIDDQFVALRRPPGDYLAGQHERLGQHRRHHAPADEAAAEAMKVAMGGVE